MPLVGRAALPDPFFYDTRLIGMPNIYYGKPQTAVRVGNAPTLQTSVYTQGITPFVSVDLSQLGFSSTTTNGTFRGYGAPYYPSYYYNFGPIQITSDIHDGTYIVPLTAIGTYGVATTTMSIIVDNVLPTVSLSDITFSTTSPQKGDYMYLSGSANGTGSALRVYEVMEGLFDVNGNPLPGNYHGDIIGYDTQPIVSALASSTDGTFIKVPIQLFEYDMGQIARAVSFRIRIGVYDEAGNTASTSLIVPIQKPPPPDSCATPGACSSNVLFLPGIEGSRLYEGTGCGKTAEEKLWDPVADSNLKIIRGAGDDKVKRLFLDSTGESVCSDIYTKTDGVIDSVRGNNIYKSFIDGMNELETNGTINDWKPVAYDWRLSLDDILNSGNQLPDGRIYYSGDLAATSSPYLIQELRRLAKDSKTGKVTIVAHSNGGLVIKALLNQLGGETATTLVEKVIMVGAPQSGAPVAVGALLYGLDQGISSWGISVLHADVARELAQNSPMAYHLLPSEDYLESVTPDLKHPVASFEIGRAHV